jgi:predicted RNA methylase
VDSKESNIKKMNFSIVSILQRLRANLRSEGLRMTISKFYVIFIDQLFEIRYRIETSKWEPLAELTIDSDNKERGVTYQPTRVMPLRKLFHVLEPIIPSDSVFVDFGCGKGRVLLVASEFGFSKVIGVEFARELCEIARENCIAYKAHKGFCTEYQIIYCDVSNYVINTDENVFFMYNPFDETILTKVLCNIVASLKVKPRKILIIYYNPIYGYAIEHLNDFSKLQEYCFWTYKFAVYSNFE